MNKFFTLFIVNHFCYSFPQAKVSVFIQNSNNGANSSARTGCTPHPSFKSYNAKRRNKQMSEQSRQFDNAMDNWRSDKARREETITSE